MTPVEQITSLYIGYFGRAPDPEGLNYWVGRLNDGYTLAEAAESFSVQPESTAKYPYLDNQNIASPQAFITQVYLNLFNRVPDAAGLEYWTEQLTNGTDIGDFILDVISGAVTAPDSTIIANKVEVGADFAVSAANVAGFVYNDAAAAAALEVINGVDATDASVEAGKAETDAFLGAGTIGDTFTLTSDLDQFVGSVNNDVFQGAAASVGAFDSVQGGAGNDTLNIIGDLAGADFTGVTIEGIEVVNLTNNTVTPVDTSVFGAAVEEVWQIDGSADVTVGEGVVVGFRSGVLAGEVVVADGVTSATVALDDVATAGTLAFGETTTDDLTSVTVSGNVADAGAVVVDTATGTTSVETVNLALTSDGAVTLTVDTAVVTTVDASASTGDLTIDASAVTALESLTGGSGADTLTADNAVLTADAVVVNGGAGADTIEFSIDAAAAAVASTLTGGADGDVFALSNAASGNLFAVADEADLTESLVTISDFDAANDVLDVSGFAFVDRATQNLVNTAAAGEDNLFDVVNAVAGVTDIGDYALFDFDGDTYIYAETGGADGLDAGDVLVQLTGTSVSDISAANFVA